MTDYMNQYKRNQKRMNGSGAGVPKRGEVWWVSNLDGIKDRPVLVTGRRDGQILFRKCTSQPGNASERKPIIDYIEAGLDKVTYVDSETRQISRESLVRKMGQLSESDMKSML